MSALMPRVFIALGLLMLAICIVGIAANLIEERDRQACRDAGGTVVLNGSGEWQCVPVVGE